MPGRTNPKSTGCARQAAIIERFATLPLIVPDRDEHLEAAALRNRCRRVGVQLGTIDALRTQLCIRHALTMLTTDRDFIDASRHCPVIVWQVRT